MALSEGAPAQTIELPTIATMAMRRLKIDCNLFIKHIIFMKFVFARKKVQKKEKI
jgi:hypothetical protein